MAAPRSPGEARGDVQDRPGENVYSDTKHTHFGASSDSDTKHVQPGKWDLVPRSSSSLAAATAAASSVDHITVTVITRFHHSMPGGSNSGESLRGTLQFGRSGLESKTSTMDTMLNTMQRGLNRASTRLDQTELKKSYASAITAGLQGRISGQVGSVESALSGALALVSRAPSLAGLGTMAQMALGFAGTASETVEVVAGGAPSSYWSAAFGYYVSMITISGVLRQVHRSWTTSRTMLLATAFMDAAGVYVWWQNETVAQLERATRWSISQLPAMILLKAQLPTWTWRKAALADKADQGGGMLRWIKPSNVASLAIVTNSLGLLSQFGDRLITRLRAATNPPFDIGIVRDRPELRPFGAMNSHFASMLHILSTLVNTVESVHAAWFRGDDARRKRSPVYKYLQVIAGTAVQIVALNVHLHRMRINEFQEAYQSMTEVDEANPDATSIRRSREMQMKRAQQEIGEEEMWTAQRLRALMNILWVTCAGSLYGSSAPNWRTQAAKQVVRFPGGWMRETMGFTLEERSKIKELSRNMSKDTLRELEAYLQERAASTPSDSSDDSGEPDFGFDEHATHAMDSSSERRMVVPSNESVSVPVQNPPDEDEEENYFVLLHAHYAMMQGPVTRDDRTAMDALLKDYGNAVGANDAMVWGNTHVVSEIMHMCETLMHYHAGFMRFRLSQRLFMSRQESLFGTATLTETYDTYTYMLTSPEIVTTNVLSELDSICLRRIFGHSNVTATANEDTDLGKVDPPSLSEEHAISLVSEMLTRYMAARKYYDCRSPFSAVLDKPLPAQTTRIRYMFRNPTEGGMNEAGSTWAQYVDTVAEAAVFYEMRVAKKSLIVSIRNIQRLLEIIDSLLHWKHNHVARVTRGINHVVSHAAWNYPNLYKELSVQAGEGYYDYVNTGIHSWFFAFRRTRGRDNSSSSSHVLSGNFLLDHRSRRLLLKSSAMTEHSGAETGMMKQAATNMETFYDCLLEEALEDNKDRTLLEPKFHIVRTFWSMWCNLLHLAAYPSSRHYPRLRTLCLEHTIGPALRAWRPRYQSDQKERRNDLLERYNANVEELSQLLSDAIEDPQLHPHQKAILRVLQRVLPEELEAPVPQSTQSSRLERFKAIFRSSSRKSSLEDRLHRSLPQWLLGDRKDATRADAFNHSPLGALVQIHARMDVSLMDCNYFPSVDLLDRIPRSPTFENCRSNSTRNLLDVLYTTPVTVDHMLTPRSDWAMKYWDIYSKDAALEADLESVATASWGSSMAGVKEGTELITKIEQFIDTHGAPDRISQECLQETQRALHEYGTSAQSLKVQEKREHYARIFSCVFFQRSLRELRDVAGDPIPFPKEEKAADHWKTYYTPAIRNGLFTNEKVRTYMKALLRKASKEDRTALAREVDVDTNALSVDFLFHWITLQSRKGKSANSGGLKRVDLEIVLFDRALAIRRVDESWDNLDDWRDVSTKDSKSNTLLVGTPFRTFVQPRSIDDRAWELIARVNLQSPWVSDGKDETPRRGTDEEESPVVVSSDAGNGDSEANGESSQEQESESLQTIPSSGAEEDQPAAVSEKIQKYEREQQQLKEEIKEKSARIADLQASLSKAEKRVKSLETQLSEKTKETEALNKKMSNTFTQKTEPLRKERDQLKDKNAALQDRVKTLESQLDKARRDKDATADQVPAAREDIVKSLEAKLREKTKETEALKKRISNTLTQKTEPLRKECDQLKNENASLTARVKVLESQLDKAHENNNAIADHSNQVSDVSETTVQELKDAKKKIAKLETQLSQQQSAADGKAVERLTEAAKNALLSRTKSLKELKGVTDDDLEPTDELEFPKSVWFREPYPEDFGRADFSLRVDTAAVRARRPPNPDTNPADSGVVFNGEPLTKAKGAKYDLIWLEAAVATARQAIMTSRAILMPITLFDNSNIVYSNPGSLTFDYKERIIDKLLTDWQGKESSIQDIPHALLAQFRNVVAPVRVGTGLEVGKEFQTPICVVTGFLPRDSDDGLPKNVTKFLDAFFKDTWGNSKSDPVYGAFRVAILVGSSTQLHLVWKHMKTKATRNVPKSEYYLIAANADHPTGGDVRRALECASYLCLLQGLDEVVPGWTESVVRAAVQQPIPNKDNPLNSIPDDIMRGDGDPISFNTVKTVNRWLRETMHTFAQHGLVHVVDETGHSTSNPDKSLSVYFPLSRYWMI